MSRNNIIAVSWDHSTLARIYVISCPCLVVPVMFPKFISTIRVSNGSSFRAKKCGGRDGHPLWAWRSPQHDVRSQNIYLGCYLRMPLIPNDSQLVSVDIGGFAPSICTMILPAFASPCLTQHLGGSGLSMSITSPIDFQPLTKILLWALPSWGSSTLHNEQLVKLRMVKDAPPHEPIQYGAATHSYRCSLQSTAAPG